MKVKIQIPDKAAELVEILHKNGHKAYVVGGCVRDSILGQAPCDWDICTSATPEQMLEVFNHMRVIETGIEHGTLTVIYKEEPFEITTFRIDGSYTDNRRPDSVSFTRDIKEDLRRRDFTINAMAYNSDEGLCDPYNGAFDIERKLIRCVGNPKERFEEDALRILRALRFSCKTEFDIDEQTSFQIHGQSQSLKNISAERIRTELCKMIVCKSFPKKLEEYRDVFSVFIPVICDMDGFCQNNPYHIYDVFMHTVNALWGCISLELETRLALLFHDCGKPFSYSEDEKGVGHFYSHAKKSCEICEKTLKKMKFDNKTIKDVTQLVLYHDAPIENTKKNVKKWLGKLGYEQLNRLIDVKIGDVSALNPLYTKGRTAQLEDIRSLMEQIKKENECFSLKDLAVNGNDLILAGCNKGKAVGDTLEKLLDAVIGEMVNNNKEELLEFAKKTALL